MPKRSLTKQDIGEFSLAKYDSLETFIGQVLRNNMGGRRMAHLEVDLDAPNEELLANFAQWLASAGRSGSLDRAGIFGGHSAGLWESKRQCFDLHEMLYFRADHEFPQVDELLTWEVGQLVSGGYPSKKGRHPSVMPAST